MSDKAKQAARRAVAGAGRAFQVIEGGGAAKPPQPPSSGHAGDICPVTALGHLAGIFHFLDCNGQKRELTARALGARHDLVSLFVGDETWLRAQFPRKVTVTKRDASGVESVEEVTVDFQVNRAAAYLQARCGQAGLFGDRIAIRKPGVWPGANGLPVVHAGDQVLIDGAWQPAGTRVGDVVWAAAPPTPRPDTPCEGAVARALQEDLRALWNFRQPGGEIAVMGLLGTAYLGGAAHWRTSGFLIGGAGSGKSALQKVLRACCPLHFFSNDTSKAGLEQDVAGRAMPSFLDEQERSAGDSRAPRELLDLVLTASSGEGTRGHRGGIDGKARRIEVVGSFIMSATAPPPMLPTHLGRLTLIELDAPTDGEDHEAAHKALAAKMAPLGARLWGRMLSRFEQHQASLAVFRAALQRAGCAPREMDQLGALLAGWWILTEEELPGEREAAIGVSALSAFVRTREEVRADDAPRRMLQHLLSSLVQLDRSTDREQVGSLIGLALRPKAAVDDARMEIETARRILANYGMRVIRADDQPDRRGRPVPRAAEGNGVWFAPRTPSLGKLFDDDNFKEGRWLFELRRLESARSPRIQVRIGGSVAAAPVWVSAEELGFEPDDSG